MHPDVRERGDRDPILQRPAPSGRNDRHRDGRGGFSCFGGDGGFHPVVQSRISGLAFGEDHDFHKALGGKMRLLKNILENVVWLFLFPVFLISLLVVVSIAKIPRSRYR